MCRLRGKDGTGFETQEDREIDHGEENKGEEKVHQKEKEGRSGTQEAQNDEVGGETFDQEKVGAQGCPEAPFGAEARGSVNAGGRTGADALVEPAERFWRRRRR
jgi:hypothetical protein